MKKWLGLLGLGLTASCAQPEQDAATRSLTDITLSTYKVGQVWRYHTRLTEPNSTLTIVKIEQAGSDTIVHVHIADVQVKTDTIAPGHSSAITHSPFSKAAIDASVTELVATVPNLPDYGAGYRLWREAYLSGNAGVFHIPVKQSIAETEEVALTGTKTVEAP